MRLNETEIVIYERFPRTEISIPARAAHSERQDVLVAVSIHRDHVFCRADRHVYRAAVWFRRLASAARCSSQRADRGFQHVRADLLERYSRAGVRGGED